MVWVRLLAAAPPPLSRLATPGHLDYLAVLDHGVAADPVTAEVEGGALDGGDIDDFVIQDTAYAVGAGDAAAGRDLAVHRRGDSAVL